MTDVINMKGEPMQEQQPIHPVEQAWQDLFKALSVLREQSQKPGFALMAFKDVDGRTWALNALLRHVDRQLAFLRGRDK